MNKNKHLSLIGYFLLFAFLPFSIAQNEICDHPDYPALVDFYNAANGENWVEKWNLSDCDVCNWFGLKCNQENRIISISLDKNGLTGIISSKIENLEQLQGLVLNNNNITGGIPQNIGNLTNLSTLILNNNLLDDTIPSEIGRLEQMSTLILNNNSLRGSIPKTLGNLTNLSILLLNDNVLTGNLSKELGNLSKIENLSFSNNQLEGLIPAELAGIGIRTLVPVQIRMNNNFLSGCFPSALKTWCKSLPPIKFYTIDLLNNPALANNGDFFQFCDREDGLCQTNNCSTLNFIGETKQITVSGLTTTSKVEIISRNTNYQTIIICENDCAEMQIIPDLQQGEYIVKVNLFDGENYCYREESVIVEGDGNNEKANCEELTFSSRKDTITVDGLTASYDKVEILGRNTNWQVVTICDGDCSDTQFIPDLQAGQYAVKVNQGGNDPDGHGGSYCYREEKVLIENSGDSRNALIAIASELLLYPNPARNRVYLQLASLANKEGVIRIYNAFGQAVQTISSTRLESDLIAVDLNGYENGMYLVTIHIDGLPRISRRFVVEHLK